MTVWESDRLHSQLSRFEDMFPGYRMEMVEGAMVASPLKPHHARTVRLLWNALEEDRAYARRGIPHYLIFDPYRAECTALGNPGPDGFRDRDVVPYGETVVVEAGIGTVCVDTAGLPVDPSVVS